MAGAFGGLLAYYIVKMDGLGGLHGWQWVCTVIPVFGMLFIDHLDFYIGRNCNSNCCLHCLFLYIRLWVLLTNFFPILISLLVPEQATWLTKEERVLQILRLKKDTTASSKSFDWKQVRAAFTDWVRISNPYFVFSNSLFRKCTYLCSSILGSQYRFTVFPYSFLQ